MKVFHRNPVTIQAVAKTISFFPQNGTKVILLKTISTQLIEHAEGYLVPTQNLHLHVLISTTRKGTLQSTKIQRQYSNKSQNNLQSVLPATFFQGNGGTNIGEVIHQCLVELKTNFIRWNSYKTLLRSPRARVQIPQSAGVKPNTIRFFF